MAFSFSTAFCAESNEEEGSSLGLVSNEETRVTDPVMIARLEAGLDPITGEPFARARSSTHLADGKYSSSVSSFPSTSATLYPEAGKTIWLKISKSATTNLTVYWKVTGVGTSHWYTQDVVTTFFTKTFSVWGKGSSDGGWSQFYITFNSSTVSSFDYEVYH